MTKNRATKYRDRRKRYSNNSENPNQNVCAHHVARCLGVSDQVRYLHNLQDLLRATRKKWSVRSRKSVWTTKYKKIPLTVNQFLKHFNDFNELAEGQKSVVKKHYWCPSSKEPWIEQTTSSISISAYIVYVKGHVLLVNHHGEVHVDTAPKKGTDRRKILKLYAVGQPYKSVEAVEE